MWVVFALLMTCNSVSNWAICHDLKKIFSEISWPAQTLVLICVWFADLSAFWAGFSFMVWFLQLTSSRGPVGGWGIQSNIHATNLCQPTESADVWSHLAGSGMVHHDQVNRGLCEEGLDIQFPLGWGDWIAEFISAVLVANFFSCETGWSQGIRRWEVYGVMRSSLNDLKDNATQTTVFCCCLCRATVNCGVYFRGFGGKVLVGGHKGITPPPQIWPGSYFWVRCWKRPWEGSYS